MKTIIDSGTKIKNNTFGTFYIITSITDKRINLDQPGCNYTTSTGRSSSKFFVGHKRFLDKINSGEWSIL